MANTSAAARVKGRSTTAGYGVEISVREYADHQGGNQRVLFPRADARDFLGIALGAVAEVWNEGMPGADLARRGSGAKAIEVQVRLSCKLRDGARGRASARKKKTASGEKMLGTGKGGRHGPPSHKPRWRPHAPASARNADDRACGRDKSTGRIFTSNWPSSRRRRRGPMWGRQRLVARLASAAGKA